MGCVSSGVSVAPSSKPANRSNFAGEFAPPIDKTPTDQEVRSGIESSLPFLLNHVHAIKCPSGVVPPLVLARPAFPVLISKMNLGPSADVRLPIITLVSPAVARIICFGSILMATRSCIRKEDVATLFHNVLDWLNSGFAQRARILVIGIPESYVQEMGAFFTTQGFTCERGTLDSDFANCHSICVSTKVDLSNNKKIHDFLKAGGGIAVFYVPDCEEEQDVSELKINPFLYKFGIQYGTVHLSKPLSQSSIQRIPNDFRYLKEATWKPMVSEFFRLTESEETGDSAVSMLDELVTGLRFHIIVAGEREEADMLAMRERSEDYLRKTNFSTPAGVCPHKTQVIIALLTDALVARMDIADLGVSPAVECFPGDTRHVPLGNHLISVRLRKQAWISTGLWCPPGHVASVEYSGDLSLHLQVGSHPVSLLAKPGPWMRRPSVVSLFPLANGVTHVATSVGGMVYVVTRDLEEEGQTIKIKFQDFCVYPRAVLNKPAVWEATKNSEIPWGEVMTTYSIITLEKKTIEEMADKEKVMREFDELLQLICSYTFYEIVRPMRIVFDVDMIEEEYTTGYPITLKNQNVREILLDRSKPTGKLFYAVMAIATVMFRNGCFDKQTEESLAAFVAYQCFQKLWPDCDPNLLPDLDLPVMFRDLWLIHTEIDAQCIPTILRNSQRPETSIFDVPEDKWLMFVKDVSVLCQKNFVRIFERYEPIATTITSELERLQLEVVESLE